MLGLTGAAVAAFSFRAQLYGVSAADPIAYGAALLTVTVAVALAVWLPVLLKKSGKRAAKRSTKP